MCRWIPATTGLKLIKMKHLLITFLSLLMAFGALSATDIDDVPNVHLADSTRFVSNPDGILSPACVDSLDRMLQRAWQLSSAEPVVIALRDIPDSYEPIDFAVKLGEKWGVGKSDKDNGVILLLLTDRHKMTIAPGYGAEGVLPDALCNRIIRDYAIPYFREDNYDAGMIAATAEVCKVLTDPAYAGELRSAQKSNAAADEESWDILPFIFGCGVVALLILLAVMLTTYFSGKKSEVVRYNALATQKQIALFLSFLCLGVPLPAFIICVLLMKHLRDHKRNCPNCAHPMRKLDEVTDNEYLTPAQDTEERINSVDYDVWLCDNCGETDIIPYINKKTSYSECPYCHSRACQLVGTRTVQRPTTTRAGLGENIYVCRNCGKDVRKPYEIAKLAAPVVIIGGGGGFGSGGGGFGGGSFGGGSFGGGGATGSW